MKTSFSVCDNCLLTVESSKIVWQGCLTFCSECCRETYNQKHKDSPYGPRPAHEMRGEHNDNYGRRSS